MDLRKFVLGVAAAAILTSVSPARAGVVVLGPGTGIGEDQLDTIGTRLNVDLTRPVTLGPGTYAGTTFTFDAGAGGRVQPFLALVAGTPGSGTESYRVIAAGAVTPVDPNRLGVHTAAFGGAPFTVPAGGETVYAGFTDTDSHPILFAGDFHPGPPANDAHRVFGGLVDVGSTFTEDAAHVAVSGTFELQRRYAFSVNLKPLATPEPASLTMLGVGAVGLLAYKLRRRKPAAA